MITGLRAALIAAVLNVSPPVATLFASSPEKEAPAHAAPIQYLSLIQRVGPNWCLCHRLSFPCQEANWEIAQYHLFGKTNSTEVLFPSGRCLEASLICIEAEYEPESGTMHLILAETNSGDSWPDDFADCLQWKKGIDEFEVLRYCDFLHVEWDECWPYPPDPDKRKADFLELISRYAR